VISKHLRYCILSELCCLTICSVRFSLAIFTLLEAQYCDWQRDQLYVPKPVDLFLLDIVFQAKVSCYSRSIGSVARYCNYQSDELCLYTSEFFLLDIQFQAKASRYSRVFGLVNYMKMED
jgi:hypothetical protein